MSITTNVATFIRTRYHGLVSFLALFIVWSAVSHYELVSAEYLPSPPAVAKAFVKVIKSGQLGVSLGSSLVRIAEGFFIGTTLGFLFGVAMGVSATAERLFAPLFNALRQVPIIGWIPLIIVWCGINEPSKISFISIGAFFPILLSTFEGIRSVSKSYLEVAQVFEYNRIKLLRKIVVPGAVPNIVSGIRLSMGTSWLLVVWAEINTRSAYGIGDLLSSAGDGKKPDIAFVCIIVIGIVAFLINELFGHLEARLSTWRKSYR
ncbi:putative aliphatic sulfonates transport permease protein SsuC [Geobacter sp. OR-1]|uniref:ABC transporter permease n=1 Tax=Geobacter sp. OR-1 TaxID=1266765 RepID=UPI000543C98A|nr:ABC transporter permease [Geobacter sp. OR-1]GAM10290.1 putative aliphatic sulfonates transport permease protein SsuC [Geobacter sp. OR-1]